MNWLKEIGTWDLVVIANMYWPNLPNITSGEFELGRAVMLKV